jgi:glycosyltransferase involved in cell wall biosynthesis
LKSLKPNEEFQPLVTVIVPVWNDVHRIKKCVQAIQSQNLDSNFYEVIVVDNSSTDGTFEVLSELSNIIVLNEPSPGSYAARNRALSIAKGKYVAFTDSDCLPSKNWLDEMLNYYKVDPSIGLIAGAVDFFIEESSDVETAAIDYESLFSMDQKINAHNGVSITANWFSTKKICLDFGKFDASLKSGGDHALSKKISDKGFTVIYGRNAVVAHPRRNISQIISKRKRIVGGKWSTQKSKFKFFGIAYSNFKVLVKRFFYSIFRSKLSLKRKVNLCFLLTRIYTTALTEALCLALGAEPKRQ